ncbi:hypothetical protein L2755_21375 [Shewanella abyssi]|uniref:hypothetical protein n=1 Tax=Shewanella abyssi TaxID=311789 RepID=UPI00200BE57F|nr:hypothetical protein [Shewanella abyssi]MCL1052151.1 hypothetical protein [Shewanella abyssi]
MKLLLNTLFVLMFSTSTLAVELDVNSKEWKKLDLPNRFPQTLIISNDLQPIYFETGENSSELSELLVSLNKNTLSIDVDSDDILKIKNLTNMILETEQLGDMDKTKYYLINVSVSKLFDCEPCIEQQDYIKILDLRRFNMIDINLI